MEKKIPDRWNIAGAILTAVEGAITLFVSGKKGSNSGQSLTTLQMSKWQKTALCGAVISSAIVAVDTPKEDWKSIGGAAKKAWPKIFKAGDFDRWNIAGAILTAEGGAITLFSSGKKGSNSGQSINNTKIDNYEIE